MNVTVTAAISAVEVSEFGNVMVAELPILASASYDQSIKLWNVATGQFTYSVPHNESQVNHEFADSHSACGFLKLSHEFPQLVTLPLQINSLCLTPDGRKMAASAFQYVRMYDLLSNECRQFVQYEACSRNVTACGFLVRFLRSQQSQLPSTTARSCTRAVRIAPCGCTTCGSRRR